MSNLKTIHTPVNQQSRIKDIDIIRGFALFGVLLVNVMFFNSTFSSTLVGQLSVTNPLSLDFGLNQMTAVLISLFAEGKFYTIFSFLFGLGFYIFISRAEEKGISSKPLFKRRMFLLFIFGLINLIFVWYGDILHVYALGGFILLFFKDKSIPSLKRWVFILLIFTTIISSLFFVASPLDYQAYGDSNPLMSPEQVEHSFEVFKNGNFIEIVSFRVTNELPFLLFYFIFIIPKTLALFLLGMIAGKLNIFRNIHEHMYYIHKVWKVTGIVGSISLIAVLFSGYPILNLSPIIQNSFVYGFFYELGTVVISLFYITSLMKLMRSDRIVRILHPLQYVGRMALTNYLVQCVVCSLVFYGYGLGYIGEIGVITGIIFTMALFTFQVVVSRIWFKHYNFGPLEFIWRKYTYGKVLNH